MDKADKQLRDTGDDTAAGPAPEVAQAPTAALAGPASFDFINDIWHNIFARIPLSLLLSIRMVSRDADRCVRLFLCDPRNPYRKQYDFIFVSIYLRMAMPDTMAIFDEIKCFENRIQLCGTGEALVTALRAHSYQADSWFAQMLFDDFIQYRQLSPSEEESLQRGHCQQYGRNLALENTRSSSADLFAVTFIHTHNKRENLTKVFELQNAHYFFDILRAIFFHFKEAEIRNSIYEFVKQRFVDCGPHDNFFVSCFEWLVWAIVQGEVKDDAAEIAICQRFGAQLIPGRMYSGRLNLRVTRALFALVIYMDNKISASDPEKQGELTDRIQSLLRLFIEQQLLGSPHDSKEYILEALQPLRPSGLVAFLKYCDLQNIIQVLLSTEVMSYRRFAFGLLEMLVNHLDLDQKVQLIEQLEANFSETDTGELADNVQNVIRLKILVLLVARLKDVDVITRYVIFMLDQIGNPDISEEFLLRVTLCFNDFCEALVMNHAQRNVDIQSDIELLIVNCLTDLPVEIDDNVEIIMGLFEKIYRHMSDPRCVNRFFDKVLEAMSVIIAHLMAEEGDISDYQEVLNAIALSVKAGKIVDSSIKLGQFVEALFSNRNTLTLEPVLWVLHAFGDNEITVSLSNETLELILMEPEVHHQDPLEGQAEQNDQSDQFDLMMLCLVNINDPYLRDQYATYLISQVELRLTNIAEANVEITEYAFFCSMGFFKFNLPVLVEHSDFQNIILLIESFMRGEHYAASIRKVAFELCLSIFEFSPQASILLTMFQFAHHDENKMLQLNKVLKALDVCVLLLPEDVLGVMLHAIHTFAASRQKDILCDLLIVLLKSIACSPKTFGAVLEAMLDILKGASEFLFRHCYDTKYLFELIEIFLNYRKQTAAKYWCAGSPGRALFDLLFDKFARKLLYIESFEGLFDCFNQCSETFQSYLLDKVIPLLPKCINLDACLWVQSKLPLLTRQQHLRLQETQVTSPPQHNYAAIAPMPSAYHLITLKALSRAYLSLKAYKASQFLVCRTETSLRL